MNRRTFTSAAIAFALGGRRVFAEESGSPIAPEIDALRYFSTKTSGGKQFWADVCIFHDYRIQCNALTGGHRLLDGRNCRQASGTLDECRAALDDIRQRDNLPPMKGRAVIVLHGLFRHRATMEKLRTALVAHGGFSVCNVGYPTTRGGVADHARTLDSVIRSLTDVSEINFVAHSLGNLVVRHWLKDLEDEGRSLPAGQSFGRMVMLTPPNSQPQLATKLVRGALATFVAGPAAEQLATGWKSLQPELATPPFDFGILAGGKCDDRGYNPLLPGDDDAVITVESTRLAGARDFRVVPVLHSTFMNDRRVQEYIIRFLNEGHFESDDKRQPIEKE